MDTSDDLTSLRFGGGEKPAVPLGADELVAYYEKQLAATQLVQHRLQKQCNLLAEEKLALETSLSAQTAALQQQLVFAREKAECALAEAEHAQQQVQEARDAVGDIVGAVTHLAELLDISGATEELTHSFEAVAHSTQRTFKAVAAAQERSQAVLEVQLEARDACFVSPLLTAASVVSPQGTDATKRMEEDTVRLRKDLDDAKKREQELEAEMRAAQVLFSALESEVVNLQHDQAQAAAKLQLSQEELVAARDELRMAHKALLAARSPAASALTQGLAKLDAHLVSVHSFLEGLSMPQPTPLADALGSTLQLHASRSYDGTTARRPDTFDDGRNSAESGAFPRQQGASTYQQLCALVATASGEGPAQALLQGVARKTRLRHQGAEQADMSALTQVPEAPDEGQGAARNHMQRSREDLSQRMATLAAERDHLRNRALELESRVTSLETEKEGLLRDRTRQLGMAAAAGAAGAAVAVVVATDASSTAPSSPSRPFRVAAPASIVGSESSFTAIAARDAALRRSESLEVEALRDLLRQGAEERGGAQRLLERLMAVRPVASKQLQYRKPARLARLQTTASSAACSGAADLAVGQYPDVPLVASPHSPLSRPSPGQTRSRRSYSSIASDSQSVDEAEDVFSGQCEPFHEVSRVYTRSSTALQSSYASFASEAPLAPTRRYTEDSQPHTYPLHPTEPLEGLLPAAATRSLLSSGDGGLLREGSRGPRRSYRTSRAGSDVQSLMAEVDQLQAALCSVLISKAVACTELQAESEQSLAALRAAHDVELAKLRGKHSVEVSQLQALLSMSADMSPTPVSQHAAVRSLDKSTCVSEDGLLGGHFGAGMLQHTASLDVMMLEIEEHSQQLAPRSKESLQRLKNDHAPQEWESCRQQAWSNQAVGDLTNHEWAARQKLLDHLQLQCTQHEACIIELREQHAADLMDQQARHSERCLQLQADAVAETAQPTSGHPDEKCPLVVYEEQLAELRLVVRRLEELRTAERKLADADLIALQEMMAELREKQLSELREKVAEKLAEHKVACAALETSQEEVSSERAAAEQLRHKLGACEKELQLRASLISDLQGQLQQLQSDKELEEQSLQSLLSTKTWMTEEIRSLQAELKETSSKLAVAEADLAAMKVAKNDRASSSAGWRLDAATAPSWHRTRDVHATTDALGHGPGGATMASPSRGMGEAQVGSVITMAADQLAEVAMQAALAEAQFENLHLLQKADVPSDHAVRQPLYKDDVEKTNLMIETVSLQGELDQLQGKYRTLQAQLEAAADELACAVMRASLAELQRDQLRLERSGAMRSTGAASSRPKQPGRADDTRFACPPTGVDAAISHGTFTPSKPTDMLLVIDAPDLLGTDAFIPVQQVRQLYRELRTVRRALSDVMDTDAVMQCPATSGDEQIAKNAQDGALATGFVHAEIARAHDVYHDTCKVYEMLRSDAEDINSQLWRWNVQLHKQLCSKENDLTREQQKAIPGPQHAFESLLSRKEAYARSVEGQLSELQAALQAAQSRLLHRDGQVAALEHMLVQLSEQITMFEDVVVRCEEVPSVESFDGDVEGAIEKLKNLICALRSQLKRYRGGHAVSRAAMPAFSSLLAARSQALQTPAATGGLSTVQVALIAAEREVLSLRSQLSHRQQHIKLLEQRLLEQSQDIAAMCNRGDTLTASPVGSRKASFVERRFGHGTEVLQPQKAWDFDGLDISGTSGNLADQMRPQLRVQIEEYRTVLAIVAGGQYEQDQNRLGGAQQRAGEAGGPCRADGSSFSGAGPASPAGGPSSPSLGNARYKEMKRQLDEAAHMLEGSQDQLLAMQEDADAKEASLQRLNEQLQAMGSSETGRFSASSAAMGDGQTSLPLGHGASTTVHRNLLFDEEALPGNNQVKELEEIRTERDSAMEQLPLLKRAKRELEARVKELTAEVKLKDEQLEELQIARQRLDDSTHELNVIAEALEANTQRLAEARAVAGAAGADLEVERRARQQLERQIAGSLVAAAKSSPAAEQHHMGRGLASPKGVSSRASSPTRSRAGSPVGSSALATSSGGASSVGTHHMSVSQGVDRQADGQVQILSREVTDLLLQLRNAIVANTQAQSNLYEQVQSHSLGQPVGSPGAGPHLRDPLAALAEAQERVKALSDASVQAREELCAVSAARDAALAHAAELLAKNQQAQAEVERLSVACVEARTQETGLKRRLANVNEEAELKLVTLEAAKEQLLGQLRKADERAHTLQVQIEEKASALLTLSLAHAGDQVKITSLEASLAAARSINNSLWSQLEAVANKVGMDTYPAAPGSLKGRWSYSGLPSTAAAHSSSESHVGNMARTLGTVTRSPDLQEVPSEACQVHRGLQLLQPEYATEDDSSAPVIPSDEVASPYKRSETDDGVRFTAVPDVATAVQSYMDSLHLDASAVRTQLEAELREARGQIAAALQEVAELGARGASLQVHDRPHVESDGHRVEGRHNLYSSNEIAGTAIPCGLQAPQPEAERSINMADVRILTAAKAALQQQYEDAEAGRAMAEQQLAQALNEIRELQRRVSAAKEMPVLMHQEMAEIKASHDEQQFEEAETRRMAVQAELDEADRDYPAGLVALEVANSAQRQHDKDSPAGRVMVEQLLAEAVNEIAELKRRVAVGEAPAQHQIAEVETSRAKFQKQFEEAEMGRMSLLAELDEARRDLSAAVAGREAKEALQRQYDDAVASRALAEQQLLDARAEIEELERRVTAADEKEALVLRRVQDVETSRAELQQQLRGAEASRSALQAELDEAWRAHSTALAGLEGAKEALKRQFHDAVASRGTAEQQLAEARAKIDELESRVSAAEEKEALMQRQVEATETSRGKLQQQLEDSEARRVSLHAKLADADRAYSAGMADLEVSSAANRQQSENADASRVIAEQRLAEACTKVEELQRRVSAAGEKEALVQCRVQEMETSRAELQQQLRGAEASCKALQAELDEAWRAHSTALAGLEGAKEALKRQYEDAVASRVMAEQQLAEARAEIEELECRVSAVEETVVLSQQRAGAIEASRAELQQQLEEKETSRNALQIELDKALLVHSTAVADMEAAKKALQQQLEDAEAGRVMAEQQLAEARAIIVDLQKRVSAAQEAASSAQQQLGEVEASRSAAQQQLLGLQLQLSAKEVELKGLIERIGALNQQISSICSLVEGYHCIDARPLAAAATTLSLPGNFDSSRPLNEDVVASVAGMRASLERRLDAVGQEASAQAARAAELEARLAEAQILVAKLEGLLLTSDAELRAATDRVKELEELLLGKEAKLQEQEVERQAIAQELETSQQRFAEFQVNVEGVRGSAEIVSAQLDEYKAISRQECAIAEQARDEAIATATAAREELESLHEALMASNAETEAYRARVAAVEMELFKVEEHVDSLQRGIRDSESQIGELRAELAAAQMDLAAARDERDDAMRLLDGAREEACLRSDEHQQQLDRFRQELEAAGMQQESLARQSAEAIAEKNAASVRADANLEAVRRQLVELQTKLTETQAELLDTVKKLADAHVQLQAACCERDSAKARLLEAQAGKQGELLGAVKELAEARKQLQAAVSERDAAAAKLMEAQAEKQAELLHAKSELAEGREQLRDALRERDITATKHMKALAEKEAELLHVMAELAETQEHMRSALTERDAAKAMQTEIQAEKHADLLRVTAELAHAREHLQGAMSERDAAAAKQAEVLAKQQAELQHVKSELAEAREQLRTALSERGTAEAAQAKVREELLHATAELHAAHEHLKAAMLERETAAAKQAEIEAEKLGELLQVKLELAEARDRLKAALSERDTAVDMRAELHAEKEAELLRVTAELAEAREHMRGAMMERDAAAAKAEGVLSERNAELLHVKAELSEARGHLRAAVVERDAMAAKMVEALAEKHAELLSVKAELMEAHEQVRIALAERDAAVAKQADTRAEKQAELLRVTAELAQAREHLQEAMSEREIAGSKQAALQAEKDAELLQLRSDLAEASRQVRAAISERDAAMGKQVEVQAEKQAELLRVLAELAEAREHLRTALTERDSVAAKMVEALAEKQAELLHANAEIVQLHEQVARQAEVQAEKEAELLRVTAEFAEAQDLAAVQQVELAHATAELVEAREQVQVALSERNTLVAKQAEALAEIQAELLDAKTELADTREHLQAAISERDAVAAKHAGNLAETQAQLSHAMSELVAAQEELRAAVAEHDTSAVKMAEILAEKQAELLHVTAELAEAREQLRATVSERDAAAAETAEAQAEKQTELLRIGTELAEAREQLRTALAERDAATARQAELQAEKQAELLRVLAELTEAREQQRKALLERDAVAAKQAEVQAETQAELLHVTDELAEAREHLRAAMLECDAAAAQQTEVLAEKEAHLQHIMAELAQAREHLQTTAAERDATASKMAEVLGGNVAELLRVKVELTELREHLRTTMLEHDAANTKHAEVQAEKQAELLHAKSELAKAQEHLGAALTERDAEAAKHAEAQAEKHAELLHATAELAKLRQHLGTVLAERDAIAKQAEVVAEKQEELLRATAENAQTQEYMQTALAERDAAAAKQAEILEEKQAELLRVTSQLAEAREQLRAALAECSTATAKQGEILAEKQADLLRFTAELAQAREQLRAALAERDIVAAKRAEVEADKQAELLCVTAQLAEAREHLRAALTEHDAATAKQVEVLAEKQAELLHVRAELAHARDQLRVTIAERDAAAAKQAEVRESRHADLLRATTELAEAREQLRAAISERDAVAAKQAEVLAGKQAELLNMTTDLAQTRGQLHAALSERDNALVKQAEAATRLSLAREAADAKRAEHEATVKLLETALAAKDTACSDLSSLRSELLTAVKMLSDAQAERDTAVRQLEDLRVEVRGLQSEVPMLAKHLIEAQEQSQDACNQHEAATARLLELEAQLVATGQLLASAHEAIESRRAEHAVAMERLDTVLADKDKMSTDLAEARSQVLTALNELSEARAQRDAALQQLNAVRDVLTAIEDERSSSAAAAAVTAAVMREQQRTVEAQQRNLDASRASEAARVAQHLRALELRADDLTQHAEDLQRRLNAAEAHLSSERAEAQVVRARLELHLASTRTELEATAAERTAALQQLAAAHAELVEVTGRCADLEDKIVTVEQLCELVKSQLDATKQQLLEAEDRAAADRIGAETAQAKAEELQGKLRADLAAAHAELVAVAAQRDALDAQLAVLLPTLSAAQAEHAAGVRQLKNLKGDQALLESQLGPLEEHAKVLEQQAENLRQQLVMTEARHVAEKAETQNAIARLEAHLEAVRADLAASTTARDVSAQQLAQLRLENHELHAEHLQHQIGKLQEQLTGAEVRLAAERNEVHSARMQAAAVRSELAAVMTERDTVSSQAAALRTELASIRSEHESAAQQHALTLQAKASLEEQVKSHQHEIVQLEKQLERKARLREQLTDADAKLRAERESHTATQGLLAAAKAEVSQVHGELAALRKELTTATKELAAQHTLTESRIGEMQVKVAQARAQASEESDKVQRLKAELLEVAKARQDAERQLVDRDVDAKGIAAGLEAALEATRATLEAERARGEQKAKAAQQASVAAQQRVLLLDSQLSTARAAESDAQRALAEARQNIGKQEAEAASRIMSLEADLAAAKEAIASLEDHQKHAVEASRNAEEELRLERERMSQLEPRLAMLADEVAALQAELANARSALHRYEAYAVDAEAEIQELRTAAEVSSAENLRLQQQLDHLVDQLRRQTQQLRAAEADTAHLREEVAAMNIMGTAARRSGSSISHGRSGERRHGSAGRTAVAGGRPSSGSASILEDQLNHSQQQMLILRKPHHGSRHPSPAIASAASAVNNPVSRTGEDQAGRPARPRASSVEPRPLPVATAQERHSGDATADTRSMSPTSLLQKRLTDEATQLRWEVVADSSRVRELQEKRAGGVYLTRAEVSEMELLTARLGAHHARISAIMDTAVSPAGRGMGLSPGGKLLESPSRMRFFDLETRAEPAELPRAAASRTDNQPPSRREVLDSRDETGALSNTAKYAREMRRPGEATPNRPASSLHVGMEYGDGNSPAQVQSGSDSVSPQTLGLIYRSFPSPSNQSVRSTVAIINVSPWYPPGPTPGRVISPVRAASPANLAGRAVISAVDTRGNFGGRSAGTTPVRERTCEGAHEPRTVETDEAVGIASSVLSVVGGEALGVGPGGPGAGVGGAPRAATRYRTPYLRMLQDMVMLGVGGGVGGRGGGASGTARRTGSGGNEATRPSNGVMNAAAPQHPGSGDAGHDTLAHWGSGGGADGSQGVLSLQASAGASHSRGPSPCREHVNRLAYMPTDMGAASPLNGLGNGSSYM
ncbi:hypothetical protein VOLCADRAFT_118298 [Volvox carteri f. nagariensis]|uniref:Uncharacterized protein n=1 Tax=Volvox carteri f. nagariensis TaxID=3068 RepID=D8U3I3_VOLCA|nr:uncharacterized protein VOLCADRAFT_118298 [Volvox carteri f. nagariensis]EFJ45761.1 hypothetical protein VOLCADRAFT_118298 [Volvox carteri f. nagariensis]|eukprot:XP_002953162.1 hypothetical protein VOLCADRAFT_118298 [Volvox carteri f. nagariensis]